MTLELAKKRRDQSDLIDELVAVLERLLPYVANRPMGYLVTDTRIQARALIERAKEHDCIPIDDAAEVAQDGTRW